MALQLGYLRDALLEAKVSPELASKAAEEVAAFDGALSKLTASVAKLTTLMQISVALTTALLVSQFALWTKLGDIAAQIARLAR